jgi:hypothetical protein
LIHCSDAHLQSVNPLTRQYADIIDGTSYTVYAPRITGSTPTSNACGGAIKAFTYPAGGQVIIILCSDGAQGALKSSYSTSITQWRTEGNLKEIELTKDNGLDALGMYLSTMILHELMHAASFAMQAPLQPGQCKSFPQLAS